MDIQGNIVSSSVVNGVNNNDNGLPRSIHTPLPTRAGWREPTCPSFHRPRKRRFPRATPRRVKCPFAKLVASTLFKYELIDPLNFGIKLSGKPYFNYPSDVLLKSISFNSKTGTERRLKELRQYDIEDHLHNLKTFYFTSNLSSNLLFLNLDIDWHYEPGTDVINDCDDIFNDVNERFFFNMLYKEKSTNGNGIHSYYFIDISNNIYPTYKEKVQIVELAKQFGSLMNKSYKGKYISIVETKAYPLIKYATYFENFYKTNENGYINGIPSDDTINRGTLAKLPRFYNGEDDISKRIEIFNNFLNNHSVVLTEDDLKEYIKIFQNDIMIKENNKAIYISSNEEIYNDSTNSDKGNTTTIEDSPVSVSSSLSSFSFCNNECGHKVTKNRKKPPHKGMSPEARVGKAIAKYYIKYLQKPFPFNIFDDYYISLGYNTDKARDNRIYRYNKMIVSFDVTKIVFNDVKEEIIEKLSVITEEDINKVKEDSRRKVTHEILALVYYSILTKSCQEDPVKGIQALHTTIYGHKLNKKGKLQKSTIARQIIAFCKRILLNTGFIKMEYNYISPILAKKENIAKRACRYVAIK